VNAANVSKRVEINKKEHKICYFGMYSLNELHHKRGCHMQYGAARKADQGDDDRYKRNSRNNEPRIGPDLNLGFCEVWEDKLVVVEQEYC
jgi:hypothetical protein